ncbi:response regulator transcription factor [Herbaspirillum sp. alder98]|uniref:response regulator transcription factor n=1 Tax=Herbaspirillum sp. alder98 TaxID=2913096 RepID=UPI001CD8AA62|nr:response regulator transcription factor [Herbaspirillum sp. alder98]MCA1326741.1 response regulator transcription factor [Herbaspirillum sp. alder98]
MEQSESDEAVEPVSLAPVLLVEDDPASQQRLSDILCALGCSPQDIFCAATVQAAGALLAQRSFSCALIDVGLPDGSGIDLIDQMRERHPAVQAVVISSFGARDVVFSALRAGAIGYLMKERSDAELMLLLASIRAGGAPIDPFVARDILALVNRPAVPVPDAPPPIKHPLSKRELQILQLVAQGLTNREIAESVELSTQTVECHTKSIYRKLSVGSRTQAVYRARQHRLLS